MRLKLKFIVLFFLLANILYSQNLLKNPVIDKIIYRKEIIDFNQPTIIHIYLNPMKATDVNIFFNEKEIFNITKNLKSFDDNYDNFSPYINFEVNELKEESIVHIFVTLSEGLVVDAIEKIKFYKSKVIDDDKEKNFVIKTGEIFYVNIATLEEGSFYNSVYDKNFIFKIEDIVYNNTIYSRFEARKKGTSLISIYKFNESSFFDNNVNKLNNLPIKEFKITIE